MPLTTVRFIEFLPRSIRRFLVRSKFAHRFAAQSTTRNALRADDLPAELLNSPQRFPSVNRIAKVRIGKIQRLCDSFILDDKLTVGLAVSIG